MLKKVVIFLVVSVLVGLVAACAGVQAPSVTVVETVVVEKEVEKEVVVTVEVPAEAEMAAVDDACTYNAYRLGWIMDYADANNIVNEVFHPDSPHQYTLWDDEEFRELIDQALVETDADARGELYRQAEDILINEQTALVPVYFYDRTGMANPEWTIEYPPFGAPHFIDWSGPRDTLIYSLGTEPPSLDINLATDTTSHSILNQLMEALYRYDVEGNIEPAGATGYEVSDDGTVYTVKLREDAVWSDGEPVVAQHYVDGITRLLNPETAAEYAYVMYYVDGAEAFNTGESDDPSLVGVKALDDYTLEISLSGPQAFFDNLLAFFTTYPVRLDVIEEYGDQWTEPGNFVGNGPYNLVEWTHEDSLAIEANPLYHDADKVSIQRVEFPIITDKATSLAAFENGEVDVLSDSAGYPNEELPRILEDPVLSETFLRLPRPGVWYIGFNTEAEHTNNLKFRQALSHALDKRSILDNVGNWPWRLDAYGVIPPELAAYQGEEIGFQYDPDQAKALLEEYMAEAGIESPEDIVIDLWYNRGNEEIIQAIAAQWSGNLGIFVNQINMEWPVYLSTLDQCNN
jgi:oligopeptide transport system substrate-binding protein